MTHRKQSLFLEQKMIQLVHNYVTVTCMLLVSKLQQHNKYSNYKKKNTEL